MYGHAGLVGTATTAAALPFTGLALGWVALAAFALFAAGVAILRLVPRTQA